MQVKLFEYWYVANAAASEIGHPRRVHYRRKNVFSIRIKVSIEREGEPAHKLRAIARPGDLDARDGFLLHANIDGALIVLEDFLQLGRLFAAALVNAVESLRVFAWVIVDFQFIVAAHLELVRHRANLHAILNRFGCFQVRLRLLEAVVEERVLAGAHFLNFGPRKNA